MKKFMEIDFEDALKFESASTLTEISDKFFINTDSKLYTLQKDNDIEDIIKVIDERLKSKRAFMGKIVPFGYGGNTSHIGIVDLEENFKTSKVKLKEVKSTIKDKLFQIELNEGESSFKEVLNIVYLQYLNVIKRDIYFAIINNKLYVDEQAYFWKIFSKSMSTKIIDTNNYSWVGSLHQLGIVHKKLNDIHILFTYYQSYIIECTIKKLNIKIDKSKSPKGLEIYDSKIKELNIKVNGTHLVLNLGRNSIEKINIDFTEVEDRNISDIILDITSNSLKNSTGNNKIGEINIIITDKIYSKFDTLCSGLKGKTFSNKLKYNEALEEYIKRVIVKCYDDAIDNNVKKNLERV